MAEEKFNIWHKWWFWIFVIPSILSFIAYMSLGFAGIVLFEKERKKFDVILKARNGNVLEYTVILGDTKINDIAPIPNGTGAFSEVRPQGYEVAISKNELWVTYLGVTKKLQF